MAGIPSTSMQGQQPPCMYNDPNVYIKNEYDQDSPSQGAGPSGMSAGSGVVTPHAMASGGDGSASGQASLVAASTASAGASTLLWTKTQQLPEEAFRQLHSIYSDHFPIEARHHLAAWLEASFQDELDPGNAQHEEHARNLVVTLVQQLEAKALESGDFLTKNKLEEIIASIKRRYSHNPLNLYTTIRACLHAEMNLVQRAEQITTEGGPIGDIRGTSMVQTDAMYQIQEQLRGLKKSTQDCGVEVERTRQLQETHSINFYKHHQISVQLEGGHFQEQTQEYARWKELRDRLAADLRLSFNNLKLQTSNLANHHLDVIKQLKELQFRILDQELNRWKRDQQLSGNGAPFTNNLDTIQKWCEDLAEIIWINMQQIRQLEMIQEQLNIPSQELTVNILPELSDGLTMLLDSLVKSSFVIEKQPPQVLKTNTRFSATVRLLVGTKLNVHMSPPVVTVSIISEAQANSLLRTSPNKKSRAEYSSGEILNNRQTMEYHQATGQLSVSFRNMSLKKIKRAEKKGTESVMDEKFALLFWSEFTIGNGEFSYQVCAPSLPVVVIVHGNQEPHAWATILWDNAFAEWGRQPFLVPDKVPWCQVANTLNMKFKASCGRGLTEENLRFLASKAFRHPNPMSYVNHDFSNLLISWSQFCKEPLPDRSFTFWDWFHAVMKLTKEDLRPLWTNELLMGFISRQEAEDFLHKSQDGTFLIRFSDSELGGVTVAWITVNEAGHREVAMLQPFTRKDLMIRSLPDRLKDCPQMVTLFPTKPKDQVFGSFYSQQNENMPARNPRNGYVPHHLVNVIQGVSSTNRNMDSMPGTPATLSSYYDPASPNPSVSSINERPCPRGSKSSRSNSLTGHGAARMDLELPGSGGSSNNSDDIDGGSAVAKIVPNLERLAASSSPPTLSGTNQANIVAHALEQLTQSQKMNH